MDFFLYQIMNIHQQLPSSCNAGTCSACTFSPTRLSFSLSSFELTSVFQISSIISKVKSMTCQLDPLPSNLVKLSFPSLGPLITNVVHSVLISGSVPALLKTEILTPVLKKWFRHKQFKNLESAFPFQNYWTVGLLVHKRLTGNNLNEEFQFPV